MDYKNKINNHPNVIKNHLQNNTVNDLDKALSFDQQSTATPQKKIFNEIDLNQDGKTNLQDYGKLFDFIYRNEDGLITLSDAQKQLADRDNNGKVDLLDLYKVGTLISENIYNSISPNKVQKGDLNNDGKINDDDIAAFEELNFATLGFYVDKPPTKEMIEAADFNGDGVLNGDDLKELESMVPTEKKDSKQNEILETNKLLGDLNFDGSVDYDDLEILGNGLSSFKKKDKLTIEQQNVADINQDGRINYADTTLMSTNIANSLIQSIDFDSKLKGDLNNDGKIDKKDEWIFIEEGRIVRDPSPGRIIFDRTLQLLDLNRDGKIDKKDYDTLHYDLLHNEKPKITPPTKIDPNNWMVSQKIGPTNLNEDKPFLNGNCGPASLLMVARMFGKIGGGAEEANKQIELMRELMGAVPSEHEGTANIQIIDGAQSLGLSAKNAHSNINDIARAIQHGKKVIAGVDPRKYGPTTISNRHFVVISDFDGERFTVYDPGFQKPLKLTEKQLELALENEGNNTVIIGQTSHK